VGAQIMSGSASSTSSQSTQALARMDLRGVKMSACHGMEHIRISQQPAALVGGRTAYSQQSARRPRHSKPSHLKECAVQGVVIVAVAAAVVTLPAAVAAKIAAITAAAARWLSCQKLRLCRDRPGLLSCQITQNTQMQIADAIVSGCTPHALDAPGR
jgi:hypothetical protein